MKEWSGYRTLSVLLLSAALAAGPVAAQGEGEGAPEEEVAEEGVAEEAGDEEAISPADEEEIEEDITGAGILVATLDGAGVPGGGDASATGRFRVEIDAGAGDYCYTLTVRGLRGVSGAVLGQGAAGEKGKVLFDLQVTGQDGDLCRGGVPSEIKPILDNPSRYYVQVASSALPDGAIRGQLRGQ